MMNRTFGFSAAAFLSVLSPRIVGTQIPTKPAHPTSPIPVEVSASCKKTAAFPEAGKNGYTKPRCTSCRTPSYTDDAFRKRIQGMVVLSIVILPDGRAHSVCVVRSLDRGLDQASERAVDHDWRFKPALDPDGKPAEVRMLVEMDFHLR